MDFKILFNFLAFDYWLDYIVVAYLIVFVIQLLFYLGVFARLAFYKDVEEASSNPVSVIICAKNERDNLLAFLPDYLTQDYPVFEVVVVNDSSIDDTQDVLKAFSLQHSHLKIVTVPDTDRFFGSKKFALTLGIKAAKYDQVLLTDADCRPSSNKWIRLMTNYVGKKKIILGFGAYQQKKGLLNKLIRFETLYTAMQYLSFALIKLPYMGVGRNLAYHSDLFFNNKGFASHQHILSGDDDLFINEVSNKSNTQIIVNTDAHTISEPKDNFVAWVKQKKRHFTTGTHYRFKHKFMLGALQLSQLLFYMLFIFLMIKIKPFYLILGVFVIRYLVQILVFSFSVKKLGGKDLLVFLPFFEIFFMLFNPLLVISNTIIKNTKWS